MKRLATKIYKWNTVRKMHSISEKNYKISPVARVGATDNKRFRMTTIVFGWQQSFLPFISQILLNALNLQGRDCMLFKKLSRSPVSVSYARNKYFRMSKIKCRVGRAVSNRGQSRRFTVDSSRACLLSIMVMSAAQAAYPTTGRNIWGKQCRVLGAVFHYLINH